MDTYATGDFRSGGRRMLRAVRGQLYGLCKPEVPCAGE